MRKLILIPTCVVVIFSGASSTSANDLDKGRRCVPTPTGLTGWWPADGNTDDIVGGHDALLRGDTSFVRGIVKKAFGLDGDGDFVDVPDDPGLNFGTGDFTVDLWVNFRDTAGEQILVEKYIQRFDSGPSEGWTFTKLEDNSVIIAMVDPLNGEAGAGTACPLPIPSGTWNHYAVTRAGDLVTIYMNGINVGEASSPAINLDSSSSLKFGHRGNPFDTPGSEDERGFYLNGQIDEVEIFVGVALSQNEIQRIFNAGRAGKCKN